MTVSFTEVKRGAFYSDDAGVGQKWYKQDTDAECRSLCEADDTCKSYSYYADGDYKGYRCKNMNYVANKFFPATNKTIATYTRDSFGNPQ